MSDPTEAAPAAKKKMNRLTGPEYWQLGLALKERETMLQQDPPTLKALARELSAALPFRVTEPNIEQATVNTGLQWKPRKPRTHRRTGNNQYIATLNSLAARVEDLETLDLDGQFAALALKVAADIDHRLRAIPRDGPMIGAREATELRHLNTRVDALAKQVADARTREARVADAEAHVAAIRKSAATALASSGDRIKALEASAADAQRWAAAAVEGVRMLCAQLGVDCPAVAAAALLRPAPGTADHARR